VRIQKWEIKLKEKKQGRAQRKFRYVKWRELERFRPRLRGYRRAALTRLRVGSSAGGSPYQRGKCQKTGGGVQQAKTRTFKGRLEPLPLGVKMESAKELCHNKALDAPEEIKKSY